jgi:hypothetical protein
VVALSTQFIDAEERNGVRMQSAIKFEAPVEWKPKSRRFGIEKLSLAFATSAGKKGVKGAIAFREKDRPSMELEASGPPLAVKGALGFKGEKIPIQDYSVCGVKAGSLYIEGGIKGYIGGEHKNDWHLGFGNAVSIDLKLSAFRDHYKVSLPLFGWDFDLVKNKFSVYVLGGGYSSGL